MDKVTKIFNQVSFGLELETCVHIMRNPIFTPIVAPNESQREELLKSRVKKAVKAFYGCISRKFPNIRFQLILDPTERAIRYDQWIVMPDTSIDCEYGEYLSEKYCVLEGKKISGKTCRRFAFYPVEIVTPKLTGYLGLRYITLFWYGILTAYDIVYSVNETQGLHTNISHPKMSAEKFLDLWGYYEPVLLQIVGDDRRISMWEMAVPISSTVQLFGRDFETITQNKFLSVGVKKGKNARLEVRIHAGSMDYITVTRWLMFCMLFLSLSIAIPEKNIPKKYPFEWKGAKAIFPERGKKKLLTSFFNLIKDTTLIAFLENQYNKNKEKNWPNFSYSEPRTKILKFFTPKDFPRETIVALERTKRRSCPG